MDASKYGYESPSNIPYTKLLSLYCNLSVLWKIYAVLIDDKIYFNNFIRAMKMA